MLIEGIKFTIDLPEKNKSEKVPMLDLAVWMETGDDGVRKIRHNYYEKPTTNPLVFHGRGACAIKQKVVIHGEEVKRRLLNQDREHSEEERKKELFKFCQKLMDSEYPREVRKEIVTSRVK